MMMHDNTSMNIETGHEGSNMRPSPGRWTCKLPSGESGGGTVSGVRGSFLHVSVG